ncbi:neuropeptide FF receptor 1-like isoform X2 [Dendronephthya gigantea]|nr:neuropeptide FF receptor 1-like isoform X2 [Dendronephthya gigantea]XP_028398879.1 neuropeptide FF receptor 1-like isoform X2 [Dendronephthya gigantea]XP_028398887.1 neuropeptide FF receptor 1-like isoform X2 [Dendronephthya gigantea]XP_028398896.1 neuropeptide FF receptor 1-like isoform X2 [Dendronephthya gigantea]
MASPTQHPASRTIIALIGIAAIFGNGLVLWVFFRRRKKSVKTAFDIFIINLAVSDFLAGIFILFGRFVFQPPIPENYSNAMTYCYLLWGGFLLFGCGYVSIYTCLVLTIERWLAIVKPHFYRRIKAKHAMVTITFVWAWAFLINATVFFSVKADFDRRACYWLDPKAGRAFFAFVEISMSSVLPFAIIIFLYLHIYYKVRRMKNLRKNNEDFKRRLTIIALAASIALIVGWLPTKISFMLRYTSVGGKHLGGAAHLVFIMLSLSNSFINPVLYGLYSSKFRDEYKGVLNDILCMLPKCKNEEEGITEETSDT